MPEARSPRQRSAAAAAAVLGFSALVIWVGVTTLHTGPPLPLLSVILAGVAWLGGLGVGYAAFVALSAMAWVLIDRWAGIDAESIAVYVILSVVLLHTSHYAATVRRRASLTGDALREQRHLLGTIMDHVPAMIVLLERSGERAFSNRAFDAAFPGPASGNPVVALLGPVGERMFETALGGEALQTMFSPEGPEGRHFDVHAQPHRDAAGSVNGVVFLLKDVTVQTNALAAITASEARLRSLALASASIVWLADADGALRDAQGWEEFTGQSRDEYTGAGWLQAVHPDDRERVEATWRGYRKSHSAGGDEYRLRYRDGSFRTVQAHAIPIHGTNGGLVEWIGTVRDVDVQHRMQITLDEAERERDALLQNVPHMVWIADRDGTVLFNNARWYEYTGLEPGEHWRRVTHPDDVPAALEHWQVSLTSGQPLVVEKRFRRRADGEYRWHLVQGVPLRDPSGAIHRWYGSSTDIEDQKRAIATLAGANQRISGFLSILSHELRNPISGIVTASELLDRDPIKPEQRQKALSTLARQSAHLQRIIDDLLDIARVTRGTIELKTTACDLRRLLDEVTIDMDSVASAANVRLQLERDGAGDAYVRGDPVRLRQIFMNLITNAVKASLPGQTVRMSLERHERGVEVIVEDEGSGIPKEIRESVFEPFVQAEGWRFKGLGLGLTIVRQLAELHGGSVRVATASTARGAVFAVTLPLQEPPEGAVDVPAAPRSIDRRSLLIIDDESENADTLKLLLELEGLRVDVANDAPQGLKLWSERQHALVLCDLGLPAGMTGFDVARELRARSPRPRLVAYSGYGQPSDMAEAKSAGFDAHLVKPATLAQILAALDPPLDRPG